jgi:tetratricopeptide (TPR) repeat protein
MPPKNIERTPHRRLRDYDPDTFYGRIRMSIYLFVFTGLMARMTYGLVSSRNPLMGKFILGFWLVSPFLGILLHDLLAKVTGSWAHGLSWPQKGTTAPAHSEGEALLQRECYQEAADWFAARAMADSSDWQAQAKLVEIVGTRLADPDREAEERNRLLKHPEIPEAVWAQAALDQGRFWERQGNPERAINLYKSLLWRVSEGPDAEEAKRRLKELERPSAPTPGEVGGFGP